jgi:hypothetical protein
VSDSRKNILGVRPALIVALLAMIGVYAVVTYRQRSGTGRAPEAVVLQPLPSPDISRFEPLIRQQIANAQARVENAPLDPRANVGLGMVYQAQSLLLAAGVCYRRGIALLPDDFEAHYFLALASEQAGDLDAALEVCSRATELDPSYQPARLLLGRLRWAKNEPDQAEVIFTDIARSSPILPGPIRAPPLLISGWGASAPNEANWMPPSRTSTRPSPWGPGTPTSTTPWPWPCGTAARPSGQPNTCDTIRMAGARPCTRTPT